MCEKMLFFLRFVTDAVSLLSSVFALQIKCLARIYYLLLISRVFDVSVCGANVIVPLLLLMYISVTSP